MKEKFTVKRILPWRKADRFPFTVTLPADAAEVTEIRTVCSPGATSSASVLSLMPEARTAGHLSLRWKDRGDIFLQARVDLPASFDPGHGLSGIVNPFGSIHAGQSFHEAGTMLHGTPVSVPRHRTLTGFYKDVLNLLAAVDEPYGVDIIITYRTGQ